MAHYKYIKKKGKLYGPYLYENKRVNGKVVTSYLGSVDGNSNNKKYLLKSFLFIIGIMAVILLLFLTLNNQNLTGRVSFDIKADYLEGENLGGEVELILNEGELIPTDSQIIASLGGQSEVILLADIINENVYSGDYFVESYNLSGSGEGYGIEGNGILYPEVSFELIFSNSNEYDEEKKDIEETKDKPKDNNGDSTNLTNTENNNSKIDEKGSISANETIEPQSQNNTLEEGSNKNEKENGKPQIENGNNDNNGDKDNKVEEQIKEENKDAINKEGEVKAEEVKEVEEAPKSDEPGSPVTSESSESSESTNIESAPGITGSAIKESEFRILGSVGKGKDYIHTLETGQNVEIVKGSVKASGQEIDSNNLKLEAKDGTIIVSTNYSVPIKGFGKDYFGDKELALKINLSRFEFKANNDSKLNLKLVYNSKTLFEITEEINVDKEEKINKTLKKYEKINKSFELNISDYLLENTSGIVQIKEIPDIKIKEGESAKINLTEYFYGAEGFTFIGLNISSSLNGEILSLIPDSNFKGTRKGKIIAHTENETFESNEFTVLVSSGGFKITTSREKIVVGKPVKWTKNINIDSNENISIFIDSFAENISVKKVDEEVTDNIEINVSPITGQVSTEIEYVSKGFIDRVFGTFTGLIIDEENNTQEGIEVILDGSSKEYIIEYYTSSPVAVEIEKEFGKLITISADDSLGYEDVIASTTINKNISIKEANKIKIYWRNYNDINLPIKLPDEVKEDVTVEDISNLAIEDNLIEAINDKENSSIITNDNSFGNFSQNKISENESSLLTGNVIEEINETLIEIEENNSESVEANPNITILGNGNYKRQEVPFEAHDIDSDGFIDQIDWVVPHLSNQTFEIILITQAEHLDENRSLIENIYELVKEKDDIWTEEIPANNFIRIVFERNLTSSNDITLYARSNYSNASVEVYERDKNDMIASFPEITADERYRILLSNLNNTQDTFDLKVVGNPIEFDYIVDPGLSACQSLDEANAYWTLTANLTFSDTCLNVTANNITIDGAGFSILYGNGTAATQQPGIRVVGANGTTIKNLWVIKQMDSSGFPKPGIRFSDAWNGTVINNTIITNGTLAHGILLSSGSYMNITLNYINTSSSGDGVNIGSLGSQNNTIYSNIFNMTGTVGDGISDAGYNNTAFYNTIFINGSGVGINTGLVANNSRYLYNNITVLAVTHGIFLAGDNYHSNISYNRINNSGSDGIVIIKGSNLTIGFNSINSTGTLGDGINITTSSNLSIYYNTLFIVGTGHGIAFTSTNSSLIAYNNIFTKGSGSDALSLYTGSSYNNISYNTLNTTAGGTSIGIDLQTSQDSILHNNTVWTGGDTGTCLQMFTRSVRNNVTYLNCKTVGTSASGITIQSTSQFNRIEHSNLTTTGGSSSFIISITANQDVNSNIFNNLTLKKTGILGSPIRVAGANNLFTNISINTTADERGGGIEIGVGTNNSFININVRSDGASAAILFSSGANFTIKDSILNTSRTDIADLNFSRPVNSGEWNFTNVTGTYGPLEVNWTNNASNGTLNVLWYLEATIDYNNGTIAQSANLSGYNVSLGDYLFNSTSNADGKTGRIVYKEYSRNATNIFLQNNYTLNVTKDQTVRNISKSLNLTGNLDLGLTFIMPAKISFVNSTLTNGTNILGGNISINVSITDYPYELANGLVFNWIGTNYTYYNNSLLFMMNANNLSDIGDNETHIKDISPLANNGTCYQSAEAVFTIVVCNYTSGKYNQGVGFTGVGRNLSIIMGNTNVVESATNLTIMAWIKPGAGNSGLYGNRPIISSSSVSSYQGDTLFNLTLDTLGTLEFSLANESGIVRTQSGTTIETGTWHHVVGVYNSTDILVYIDGAKSGTPAVLTGTTKVLTDNNLTIGASLNGTRLTGFFNGTIDEVSIWDRALLDDEINQQYMSNLYKYNKTNWALYINRTKNATSGLSDGIYTYFASANNSAGVWNTTDVRTVIVDGVPLKLNFTANTLPNGTSTSNASIDINITTHESHLSNQIFNWNGTNFTVYNNSIVLMYNLNNLSALIENDTFVVDISNYSNNGTVIGGANFNSTGKYGGGYQLDGLSGYITKGYDSDFDFGTSGFTAGVWFRRGAMPNSTSALQGFNVRVSLGDDDAEECISDTTMDLTSSDLELGEETTAGTCDPAGNDYQWVGVRFKGITIPKGAVISNASLEFEIDVQQSANTNLTIYGQASDNGTIFTTANANISGRTRTSAVVDWNGVPNPAVDAKLISPNISTLVQEIVDRAGWASGNSMVFVLNGSGTKEVESYDGESTAAAFLRINYTDFSGPRAANASLISRYDGDQGFKIWMNGSGSVSFGIDDDSTWNPDDIATSSSSYDDNNWHFAYGMRNSTGIYLYMDGQLVASDISIAATETLSSDSANLTIGKDLPGSQYYWNGTIDEVRVWNIGLGDSELLQQYFMFFERVNSTNWNLYVNQSKNSTAGLTLGEYTYRGFGYDVFGNLNSTEYRSAIIAVSSDAVAPITTINFPANISYNATRNSLNFNATLNENGSAMYSLSDGVVNTTMLYSADGLSLFGDIFNRTNNSISDGDYVFELFANDTAGNKNHTNNVTFSVDFTYPKINLSAPTNGSTVNRTALLNLTVYDRSNYNEIFIWASNDSANLYDYLVYHRKGQVNGTILYNWTAPVLRADGDTMLLYHFNNLSYDGENYSRVLDYAGFENNATVEGADWNETGGMFAGAYELDGRLSIKNISVADASNLDLKNFTIAMWFIKRGTGDTASSGSGGIVAAPLIAKGIAEADGDGRDVNFMLGVSAADKIQADFEDSAGPNHPVNNAGTVLANHTWYHVVYTHNFTTSIIYLNGVIEGSSVTSAQPANNAIKIGIGQTYNSVNVIDGAFNGSIDEMIIFNRSLNQDDVAQLYNHTLNKKYWQSNTTDGSGNKNSSLIHEFNITTPGGDTIAPTITINNPLLQQNLSTLDLIINISLSENGSARYSLNNGVNNFSMTGSEKTIFGLDFNATNYSTQDNVYTLYIFANDTSGNSASSSRIFTLDSSKPNVTYIPRTLANGTQVNQSSIFIDVHTPEFFFRNATFELFNNSGKINETNLTHHYSFELPAYRRVINNTDLALAIDTSDIAYNPVNGTIFTIHNTVGSESIDEIHVNGSLIRSITLTGFHDTEGIGYVNTSGGTHRFIVSEEQKANLTAIFITDATTTFAQSSGVVYDLGLGNLANLGIEGVSYDGRRNVFYIVKEKTLMEVYRVNHTVSPVEVVQLFNATTVFDGTQAGTRFTDLSGIHYDNNTDSLIISSHESQAAARVLLNGTIVGNISLSHITQTEGITFDTYGDYLYAMGESDFLSTFRTINTSTYYNFTNLLNGTYYYNVSIFDYANNSATNETRTIILGTQSAVVNVAPTNPFPKINSTLGTNLTLQNLSCFDTIIDPDGGRMNVSVEWYNQSILHLYSEFNNSYVNNTAFAASLQDGNTTKGHNWSCAIKLFDGTVSSNWVNTSVNLTILNSLPTVTLSAPANGNITINRTPTFSWSGNDDDGDTLEYELNLTCYFIPGGTCSTDTRYVQRATIGTATSHMISPFLAFLIDNNYYYNWSVRAWDSDSFGSWTTARNISIQSDIVISLSNASIQFGSLNLSATRNTTTGSPSSIVLRNDGNALTNISLNFTSLFLNAPSPSSNLQYQIRNNTANCFVLSGTQTTFAQAPTSLTKVLNQLNFTSGYQTACSNVSVDILITVPSDEPPGNKSSFVTFVASLGEPGIGAT
ncbi:MAG: LamG-like jellyroll fold domain-containing protein [Nanoarchaeota archaeon]|nr:LamG-like jellyroll fold domain-containing protein [Nanoarchaeota archaeon]